MAQASRHLIAVVVMTLLAASVAHGQESSWVGKQVITKDNVTLRIGNQVVERSTKEWLVYVVERVDGDRLWLVAGRISGWVQAHEVILFDQAIDFYTQQIRANPAWPYAYVMRGMVWKEKGELDIAIADYNEAIRLDPTYAWAFNNRGVTWRLKKDYDKAIADCNEAIRLDPKNTSAFNNRGITWRLKKDYDKAIADYNEAIRLDPKDTSAFNNRGITWRLKKDYDKAIADYNEAIRLDPKYTSAINNRATVWCLKKDYDKAIADCNEAIRLNPKDAWAYNGRAWLWATCPDAKWRDGKKAVNSATTACELTEWKEAYPIGTLAAAHAEVGEFAKAVEYQGKANRLYADPEDRAGCEERLELYREKKPFRKY